jgi:P27 family predicted phage terminase small subunit
MPRPRKSLEEHRLSNNASKRHPPQVDVVTPRPDPGVDVPPPPAHLSDLSKELWLKVSRELHRLQLLTSIDHAMFEGYCEAYATWRQYEGLSAANGAAAAVTLGYRGAADRARAQMIKCADRMGLDPKSRHGMKTAIPRPPADPAKPDEGSRAEVIRGTFGLVPKR